MSTGCDQFRNQIPRAMLADLSAGEQQSLDRHLAECVPCSQEKELYLRTFGRLRSLEDDPVPRHFLVYPEERKATPWQIFREMSPLWQGSVVAAALALFFLSILVVSRVQVRVEEGALTLTLGRPAPSRVPPAPALDTAALEAKILRIVGDKSRQDGLEWVRTLRAEFAQAQRGMSRTQRGLIETAIVNVEKRMSDRLNESARELDERRAQSVSSLYQAIKLQRDSDLALVDARLNRLAINGERKSSETDAILETLLQVAELKTK